MNSQKEAKEHPEKKDAEPGSEEKPQIYNVKKGPDGWKFSRREFLTSAATAATTAAAALTGVGSLVGETKEPTPEAKQALEKAAQPVVVLVATTIIGAAQPFTQSWRLTNKSPQATTHGARLNIVGAEFFQSPKTIEIPDIPPGETVEVSAEMISPIEPGHYLCSWSLNTGGQTAPVSSSPLIVLSGCIVESAHPYLNGTTSSPLIVTNPDTNAQSTRIHFSRLEVEQNWDYVLLKDNTGQERQRITGTYASGLWSNPIPGQIVQVQIQSDATINGWGFCVDQVESISARNIYLPIIFKQPTPTRTPTPTNTPCACYGVCSCAGNVCTCNQVCTCDTVHYWYPD